MTALWYEVTGASDAPVVVLGGSLGTTSEMWRPQLDAIEGTFRVLRFDHLGHGRSAVPPGPYRVEGLTDELITILDEAGIDRFAYCGLSLGGMIGLALTARLPQRVERLALICSAAYLPPAQPWFDRAEQVRSRGTQAVVDMVLGRWFTADFLATRPEVVQRLTADLVATSADGYAACCEAIGAMDLRGVLPSITAPTLVISGADDTAIPPWHGMALADAIPDARFSLIENAAHLANVEQPDAVTGLLVGHLTGSTDATLA